MSVSDDKFDIFLDSLASSKWVLVYSMWSLAVFGIIDMINSDIF